jgi:hypothetical protein
MAVDQFNEKTLVQRVQTLEGFALIAKTPCTLHATVQETKVRLLGYAYQVLFPVNLFLDAAVADPRDIACMKVSAIASQGTKRDFVDLYVRTKRYGLVEIMRLFDQKYAQTHYSRIHILN